MQRLALLAAALLGGVRCANETRAHDPSETAAPVWVSMQWCPDGACRTGHLMMNVISAVCLAEIFGWRYWHKPPGNMKPGLKAHDETGKLFDFSGHAPGRGKTLPLPSLSTKSDPALAGPQSAFKDEHWAGHVSWEKVLRVMRMRAQTCNDAVRTKGVQICHLELQYSWRLSLRRVYVWVREGKIHADVPDRISQTLLKMACRRLLKDGSTRPIVSHGALVGAPLHISLHARRGDRDAMWLGHNLRHGNWHAADDILNAMRGVDNLAASCGVERRTISVHTEPKNNADLTKLAWPTTQNSTFQLFKTNSLPVDFALMLNSDVFIGAPSSLSYALYDLRFTLRKTQVYDVHHKEVCAPVRPQFAGDANAYLVEADFELRWNGTNFEGFNESNCGTLFSYQRRSEAVCAAFM
ncbi:hypothetical protein M885DRAFT_528050 [Pelagophyceae sp. CCMP2097]|nr:hypothetical protein M885DRAFT_528050 [Pelagophyceae sp. CCMP2097]